MCNNPWYRRDEFGHWYPIPCGKCAGCVGRYNAMWSSRVRATTRDYALLGELTSFVTLTYSDDWLPVSEQGAVTLSLEHFRNFVKRLRRNLYGSHKGKLKYFGCGEYGQDPTRTNRPHYHIILFGVHPDYDAKAVRQSWCVPRRGVPYGIVDIKPFDGSGASYLCKYLAKGANAKYIKQDYLSQGAEPPFLRMSFGLGLSWIKDCVKYHAEHGEVDDVHPALPTYWKDKYGDVVSGYRPEYYEELCREAEKRGIMPWILDKERKNAAEGAAVAREHLYGRPAIRSFKDNG